MTQLNELGFYTLAGAPLSPAELRPEVAAAEAIGLGSAFISERYNIKEAATLSGAVGAVLQLARHRHGRHQPQHPPPARHRLVRHHHAPAHRRALHAGARPRHRPAVRRLRHPQDHHRTARGLRRAHATALAGRGDLRPRRSRRAATRSCTSTRRSTRTSRSGWWRSARTRSPSPGGRSTWSCCTPSSPTRRWSASVKTVREAAEQAGRDPAAVRIWSCYATVGDHLPEDLRLKKTVGRLATYLQGYGDLMVHTNGWDPAVLERFRADEVVSTFPGAIDTKADTDQLRAHRHPAARRVARAGRDRRRRAVRRSGAAPVRPRRRRRDHARGHACRARAHRHRLPRRPTGVALRRLAREPRAAPRWSGAFRLTLSRCRWQRRGPRWPWATA